MIEIHTLVGAYALDAVDDVERAAVERHLRGCAECAAEAAELRATAARLVDAAAVAPPPRLREAVTARIRRTRQEAPRPGRTLPLPGSGPRRWRAWTAAAVGAGILMGGAATAGYQVQEHRVRAERDRVAEVTGLLAAPDVRVIQQAVDGGGKVTVVMSRSSDRAVVMLADLPAVPPARAYELWLMRAGKPARADVLDPGATGATTMLTGIAGVDALGLTNEPAGGSDNPSPPVRTVNLPA